MTNAFVDAKEVERLALIDLEPFLEKRTYNGRFVYTDKGNLSRELQKEYGDIFANDRDGKVWCIEVKAEEENKYNNFYLETYSNRSRGTRGWMHYCKADLLWYYFLKEKYLTIIDFNKLKVWFEEHAHEYPEKPQGKRIQMNDTWGRCVRIGHIIAAKDVPTREYWLERMEPIVVPEQPRIMVQTRLF